MKDVLFYIAIGAGILFVILLILAIAGKGEHLRKWLGPIGGLIVAIVAIIGLLPKGGGTNGDLAKIQAENARIRAELDKLKSDEAALRQKYEADKAAYEKQLADLNSQLALKEAERKRIEAQLAGTASKSPLDWFNSLPEADKQKIRNSIEGKIGEEI